MYTLSVSIEGQSHPYPKISTALPTQVNVNTKDQKGWTPTCIAAFHGHKAILQVYE